MEPERLTLEQKILACYGNLTLIGVVQMLNTTYSNIYYYEKKHGIKFQSRNQEMTAAEYMKCLVREKSNIDL